MLVAAQGDSALPIIPISTWWHYSWYRPSVSSGMLGLAHSGGKAAADWLVCLSKDILTCRDLVYRAERSGGWLIGLWPRHSWRWVRKAFRCYNLTVEESLFAGLINGFSTSDPLPVELAVVSLNSLSCILFQ